MNLNKANLLLITFDQWRGDWTDPKNPIVRMPCLEQLGTEGLIARRCYTSSPQCVPARMSWLTGLAPSQMGVTRNCEAEVPADAPSVFRELQKAGWHTELIGKTHWTSHRTPGDLREKEELIKKLGFNQVKEVAGPRALQIMRCELSDEWRREGVFDSYLKDMKKRYQRGRTNEAWSVRPTILPDHLYPDIWIANQGIKAIQNMPRDQPWLLWISFIGPHEPFDTPKRWCKVNEEVPKFTKPGKWIRELADESELKQTLISWEKLLTFDSIEALRKDYANNLRLLDDQLYRLTDALKIRPDAKQTGIAITADHGEMLGDHHMLYKGTFLEGSIHVPFQYTPPNQTNNRPITINKPICLTDIFTTVIKNIKEGGQLKPIRRHIRQQTHVTIEFGEELLIIKNKKKLCCHISGAPTWAINLKKDPKEQINQLNRNTKLLSKDREWSLIYSIAQKEIKIRKQASWIWRNLKLS